MRPVGRLDHVDAALLGSKRLRKTRLLLTFFSEALLRTSGKVTMLNGPVASVERSFQVPFTSSASSMGARERTISPHFQDLQMRGGAGKTSYSVVASNYVFQEPLETPKNMHRPRLMTFPPTLFDEAMRGIHTLPTAGPHSCSLNVASEPMLGVPQRPRCQTNPHGKGGTKPMALKYAVLAIRRSRCRQKAPRIQPSFEATILKMKSAVLSSLLVSGAYAFPWVLNDPNVDSSSLPKYRSLQNRQQPGVGPGGAATCPFNPNHVPAAPVTDQYPYNGAVDGKPGKGKGGYQVPAPGDTAHAFIAPGPNDIRGPCPGLNTAANHGFLARDGIVTFNELVDAQQNLYNVGFDLATLLALLGLTLTDGDIVTERLSIGCDATSRTSVSPALTGSQPDTSLTRNDFFTAGGDNYKFNGTLFGMMTQTTGGNFDLPGLAQYRLERYNQSRRDNPNFYFGPLSLLLFGAASFLYELMPSGTHGYAPDLATISSFFGAEQAADGTWTFNNHEKIPDNWTNRVDPYDNTKVGAQIIEMYLLHPVEFGGNTADGSFNAGVNFGAIQNGLISADAVDPKVTSCLLYQLATQSVPSSLNGLVTPTVETLAWVLKKLSGTNFANLGCPQPLT
nr:aromatic peroxygenase [Quercus suber]